MFYTYCNKFLGIFNKSLPANIPNFHFGSLYPLVENSKNYFKKEPMLTKSNFSELYTKEYELAQEFSKGKITKQDYFDGAIKLWELEKNKK